MGFKDRWWNIYVTSLVILAAPYCGFETKKMKKKKKKKIFLVFSTSLQNNRNIYATFLFTGSFSPGQHADTKISLSDLFCSSKLSPNR